MRTIIHRLVLGLSLCFCLTAADWPQFHGPGGSGTTQAKLPDTWSDTENIVWKTPLPGIGASSPVVIGNRVFLTAGKGGADDLVRHVLCFDAATGDVLWDKTVESELPEQGKIREDHGYCSSTPVANATHLFVFFGKSGVFCFDHAGKQIWNTKVGSTLNSWGSAASLTLHKNLVLVNASVESESLVALDQKNGKIYYTGRGGQTVVVSAKPEFEILSSAKLENGRGVFNASPAVHGDRLLIRSNKFLYCIGAK